MTTAEAESRKWSKVRIEFDGLPDDIDEFRRHPLPFYALRNDVATALAANGARTWGDLELVTETNLLKQGIGRRGLNQVKDAMLKRGTYLGARWKEASLPPILYRQVVCGVYFIRCRQFIKIGRAKNIRQRLADISCTVPFHLELAAIVPCESVAQAKESEREHHDRFRFLRYRGEWFRYEGELVEYIRGLQEQEEAA